MKTIKVIDSSLVKRVSSEDYNYLFNKTTGYFSRWGKNKEDDPVMAPAPEILDIEISAGPCSQNCHFCFVPGTEVSLNNEIRKIEDVVVGDKIISYNEKSEKLVENKVIETYEREYYGMLILIELENGAILKVTPEHKFYIKNLGWIEAMNLTEDMDIYDKLQ